MENSKEHIVFLCTLVGGIADFVALFMLKLENAIFLHSISFIILVLIIVYLFFKYKNRCHFLQFIEHLFGNSINKFTLLPKICMAIDSTNEHPKLHITEMTINHTYDFQNVNLSDITKESRITYPGNVEYHITAKNKLVPSEFACFLGDMYADPTFSLSQKHGCQSEYENVPTPARTDDIRVTSTVTRFSWQLDKRNISHGKTFPISFKLTHCGTTAANSDHTLVFYPKQYGKTIDKVTFKICFLCEKNVLKGAEFFRIWKDGNSYKHTPVSSVFISENMAEVSFEPCERGFEAYYFRIYFELA